MAVRLAGLDVVALPANDPILSYALGVLDRQMGTIWHTAELDPIPRAYLIAHELGHWWLHPGDPQSPDGDHEVGMEWGDNVITEMDGYSPAQRREIEANAFAAELLAPVAMVREMFANGCSANAISRTLNVGESVVVGRLVAGILMGFTPEMPSAEATPAALTLDPEQRRAAECEARRTLAVAGPGTGKTRALAGRVVHLLRVGARPDRVLAVTFSRNAAEELRRRIAHVAGDAARSLSAYTIHGFGLEILRRFGHHIGLSRCPRVVDRVGSAGIVEGILADGEGGDLEYLDAPSRPVAELVAAIAHWKERGLTPSDVSGNDAEGIASSAARVFELYEARLRSLDAADFADLIGLSVAALSKSPDALRTLRGEYDHVLVDEVQDVDPLSWRLIELVAGENARLWAVGDPMQAIYSFRSGNGPQRDEREMFDAVHHLRRTYRCGPRIAAMVNALAETLGLSETAVMESVSRETDGPIVAVRAGNEAAELSGIAEHMREMESRFGPDCRQAVLCRTNAQAMEIAEGLRSLGIPAAGPATATDVGLVREALAAMLRATEPMPDSGSGTEDPRPADMRGAYAPRDVLGRWLFGETGAARSLLDPNTGLERSAMLWLWETVGRPELHHAEQACREGTVGLRERVKRVESDIRRAVALGEDRLSTSAYGAGSRGVCVMTIHASKGLEFDVVYLPRLNEGRFPPRGRPRMLDMDDSMDAERPPSACGAAPELPDEARLLYVAVSRARRAVVVSCCASLDGRSAKASPLFAAAEETVQKAGGSLAEWDGSQADASESVRRPTRVSEYPVTERVTLPDAWPYHALETYRMCPKRVQFELARDDRVNANPSPYPAYVKGLRKALRVMRELSDHAADAQVRVAMEKWDEVSETHSGSPQWAPLYRTRAMSALVAASRNTEWRVGETCTDLTLKLEHGVVQISADRVEHHGLNQAVVERFIWRHPRKNPPGPGRARALYAAASATWPDAEIHLQDRYMLSGEVVVLETPRDGGVGASRSLNRILANIRRGWLPPKPGDHCAHCPFLLACDRHAPGISEAEFAWRGESALTSTAEVPNGD